MNFFEAFKEMVDGKYCKTATNTYRVSGMQLWYLKDCNWIICKESIDNLNAVVWIICEEPKASEGLWEKCSSQTSAYPLNINQVCTYFSDLSEINHWIKALNTFMLLKAHPLAVKSNDEQNQYYINVGELDIVVDRWHDIEVKLTLLSPAFSTADDVRKCIIEIGKEKLLHMFKTFQGIY